MCNNIETFSDHSEIIISSMRYGVYRVLIDTEDIDKINKYKWVLSIRDRDVFYIVARHKGHNKNIQLHRYITDCPKGMTVDHINHNTLDNRRCNLRVCTQSENNLNQGMHSNNTSGYKNISYDKKRNRYRVYINVDKKRIELGYHKNLEDAIKVRDIYKSIHSINKF